MENQSVSPVCTLKSLRANGTTVPVARPSPERLRELLRYDPETGGLCWLARGVPRWDATFAGKDVGAETHNGYLRTSIDGVFIYVHVLCWMMHSGAWPESYAVDHINRDRKDNRIVNLRPATRSQNGGNAAVRKHSKTGVKGVQRSGDKFIARIGTGANRQHLGTFDTVEEAHTAYVRAAQLLFGEFARAA